MRVPGARLRHQAERWPRCNILGIMWRPVAAASSLHSQREEEKGGEGEMPSEHGERLYGPPQLEARPALSACGDTKTSQKRLCRHHRHSPSRGYRGPGASSVPNSPGPWTSVRRLWPLLGVLFVRPR